MKIFLPIISLLLFVASPAYAGELTGNASNYSTTGCLGCSKGLVMANGETLDDSRLTIALSPETVRKYDLMGKFVGIINLSNTKSVIAQVTDTGGFSKYNRIADLGKAVKDELECKSLCSVIIIF